ncbi:UNVERIFIED_ORG: hypothetical protein J3D58_003050 [Paenarthrobacter nicotinovorans]
MKQFLRWTFLCLHYAGRDTVTVESSNAVTTEFMTSFRGGQKHALQIGDFKVHPISGLLPERLKKILHRRPPFLIQLQFVKPRLVAQSMRYSPAEPRVVGHFASCFLRLLPKRTGGRSAKFKHVVDG